MSNTFSHLGLGYLLAAQANTGCAEFRRLPALLIWIRNARFLTWLGRCHCKVPNRLADGCFLSGNTENPADCPKACPS